MNQGSRLKQVTQLQSSFHCASLKETVQSVRSNVINAFELGVFSARLIHEYSNEIDDLLKKLWQRLFPKRACLIAVGGYGRRELFPYSDLDLVIITPKMPPARLEQKIENFIQLLWDADLKVSHIIGTLEQLAQTAKSEITLFSTLLDARFLCGNKSLFYKIKIYTDGESLWSNNGFMKAKLEEQADRFERYGDSGLMLQPDIKNCPGGLRDIQMIITFAKRHFKTDSLRALVENEFLTKTEYQLLLKGQRYLWHMYFALQSVAKQHRSRLLFDHQLEIAKRSPYQDKSNELAIEQLMKRFYRWIKKTRSLSDMLLQLLFEAINETTHDVITPINERFQVCNDLIEVTHETVFQESPSALLEIFVLMAKHSFIKNVKAKTIRLIQQSTPYITRDFRDNPRNKALFLELLRQSSNVTEQLMRMNRFDVLGKFLLPFGRVVGKMQYDLFHIYTVDHHSLIIIRNLRQFTQSTFKGQFPLCCSVIKRLSKPEILYLAGLFHDLGKGTGGDHSKKGAIEAQQFCQFSEIEKCDRDLIVWLVKYHLLMSATAQKKDIYDPVVINTFAKQVATQKRLDHLYLLTVADICATNPTLWNSWRDTLLRELFEKTSHVLSQHNILCDDDTTIHEKKEEALKQLITKEHHSESIAKLWSQLPIQYFLHEATADIVWQTDALLNHHADNSRLVLLKPHHRQGGTEVFIYTDNAPNLFAYHVIKLTNLYLNIVEARIFSTSRDHTLHIFVVLDENNKTITDSKRWKDIKRHLTPKPELTNLPHFTKRRTPYLLKHFAKVPSVKFITDHERKRTLLQITCSDIPGLLAQIAFAFLKENLVVQTAKIITMGENVEDSFYILNRSNTALTIKEQKSLKSTLLTNIIPLLSLN